MNKERTPEEIEADDKLIIKIRDQIEIALKALKEGACLIDASEGPVFLLNTLERIEKLASYQFRTSTEIAAAKADRQSLAERLNEEIGRSLSESPNNNTKIN